MKSAQRKAASNQGALEVRLNRALEEAERHKATLQKARSDSKVRLLDKYCGGLLSSLCTSETCRWVCMLIGTNCNL